MMRLSKILRKLKRRINDAAGRDRTSRINVDYQPEPGEWSQKAERLVAYCLGDLEDGAILPCTKDRDYLKKESILLVETDRRGITISSNAGRKIWDQKKVIQALIQQRAEIPPHLNAWLIRGDGAGQDSEPDQGLHLTGMRHATRRDLVLAPTACRHRYLGPQLAQQMTTLRAAWTPWDKKSDTAWWGGALTGNHWQHLHPRTLTRSDLLHYFTENPSHQVHLRVTQVPPKTELPPGHIVEPPFTKQDAFSHKCLLLLPGNDIASGSSWYFAGNSVVLMPRPHLEHILYFEMEPWKHYVPLENDPADVLTKLHWVLDNQDQAQQIVANSHERLRWLCGPEYLWACNQVLRRISQPAVMAV